jgi:cytochrome c551/c552
MLRFPKRKVRLTALSGVALVGLCSAVFPPVHSGRPGTALLAGAHVDAATLAIFERACRDCHSDETRYPWYGYIAPVSWWMRSHVARGRLHLNLSRWNAYPLVRKERSLSEIANQVKDGGMPIASYLVLHPKARLSTYEVETIFRWTQAERARLIAASIAERSGK